MCHTTVQGEKVTPGQELSQYSDTTIAIHRTCYFGPIRSLPFFNPSFESGAIRRTNQETLFSILHLYVGIANERQYFRSLIYMSQEASFLIGQSIRGLTPSERLIGRFSQCLIRAEITQELTGIVKTRFPFPLATGRLHTHSPLLLLKYIRERSSALFQIQ